MQTLMTVSLTRSWDVAKRLHNPLCC